MMIYALKIQLKGDYNIVFYMRIKQFFSAINSKIYPEDIKFIKKHLNDNEQKIFFDMDLPTQRHCLNVAYTCLDLLKKNNKANAKILLKAALLHDCGKKSGEINTCHKVAIVVIYAISPKIAKYFIKKGRYSKKGTLCRAFYIHSVHQKRGAGIAANANVHPDIIDLIKKHHDIKDTASIELLLLQQADNAN